MCNKSQSVGELAKALAAAQGEMRAAVKDSENPHFRSRFASLAACWDAVREPLAKHGLSLVQLPGGEGNTVVLTTTLLHGSGEWMESVLKMQARDPSPQAIGACLTYARRYAMSAMLGIATEEDDDGEAAQPRNGYREDPKFPAPPQRPKPEPKAVDTAPLLKAIADAKDLGELYQLKPQLRALSENDRKTLRPVFVARENKLKEQGAFDPTGDPEPSGQAA